MSKAKFIYSFNIYIIYFKCKSLHTFIRHMENHIFRFYFILFKIFSHSLILGSFSFIIVSVLLLSSVVSLREFKEVDNVVSSAYIRKLNN